ANLGTLQVAHDPDDLLAGIGGLPQSRNACALVLFRAVRAVDACYIEAGAEHLLESLRVVRRGLQGGDDLGTAQHRGRLLHNRVREGDSAPTRTRVNVFRAHQRLPGYAAAAARSSRMATAGSVLPSTNSRKAPPPVEM